MATKLDVKAMAALVSGLQWIYERAIDGVPGLEGAPDLAASYQRQCATDEEAIDALIRWQVAKAAAAGFLTNLGGLATLPIALPANVLSALYIQIRMVAAIAALRGHDLKSDQVRTVVLACLCGTTLLDVVKDAGIGVGAGLAQQADERVLVARVDLGRGKTIVAVPREDGGRPGRIEVGERDALEEVAPPRDRRDSRTDRPGPDHEYLHQRRRINVTPSRKGSRTASTRSSCRTCSLKRLIACAFSPSPSRPKSVLSAAITPRGESFGRTAS